MRNSVVQRNSLMILSILTLILITWPIFESVQAREKKTGASRDLYPGEFSSHNINSFYTFKYVNISLEVTSEEKGVVNLYIGPTTLKNVSSIIEEAEYSINVTDHISFIYNEDLLHSGLYIVNTNNFTVSIKLIMISEDINEPDEEVKWYNGGIHLTPIDT